MKRCETHPDVDTMVPCMGCGRDFCRLCEPPQGAGQYCHRCYEESLSRLAGKEQEGRFRGIKYAKYRDKPGKKAPGAQRESGRRDRPAAGKAAPAESKRLFAGIAGRWRDLLANIRKKSKDAVSWIAGLPSRLLSSLRRFGIYIKGHFPMVLKDKEKYDEAPPLRDAWPKLLAFTVGGCAVWTVITVLMHRRLMWVSVMVAFLLAVGVVWSLGARFDIPVALVTLSLALLSLVLGEVLIQVLYRLGAIKKLDLVSISPKLFGRTNLVYGRYFYNLFVHRLIPSAAVAFLVGWWPLPKRLSWRGFSGKGGNGKKEAVREGVL